MEPAILSSPDPLATSFNDSFNSLNRGTPQPLPSTFRSSPAKRRSSSGQTIQFEDVIITSPTKAGSRHSSPVRAENNPSPWRIRVTVQAEPDDEDGDSMAQQTRTRKIRLNDEQGSLSALRGGEGGRAAKSSPAKGAKRSSTPVRGRGRGRRKSVTDLDITVLGDEDGDDRPTPRKRKTGGRKSKISEAGENDVALEAQSQNRPKRARPKAKNGIEGFDIAVDEDPQGERLEYSNQDEASQEPTSNLRELDFNRVALRPRQVNGLKAGQSSVSNGESKMRSSTRQVSTTSTDYPTPEPSAEDEDSIDEEPIHPDPTDQHDEYDTIIESEGFTMISLDSLSSAKQDSGQPDLNPARDRSSPMQTALTPQAVPAHKPTSSLQPPSAVSSHLRHDHDQSEISSTVPTPPSATAFNFATTPYQFTQFQASPTLPSPPSPPKPSPMARSSTNKSTSHPRLSRVVRAGIALQGVLSPNQVSSTQKRQERLRSPLAPTGNSSAEAKERLDDLFGGFDSGMKRELRAGLRFGEELARRTQGEGSNTKSDSVMEVLDPGMPGTDEKDSADEVAEKLREDFEYSPASSTAAFVRQQDAWHQEREAVSRRIQEAKSDQVITIDSDDDQNDDGNTLPNSYQGSPDDPPRGQVGQEEINDDDDNEDIWLSQADSVGENVSPSLTPHESQQPEVLQRQAEARHQQQAQDQPPRRRGIPSPWKRGEDVDRSSIANVTGMDETSGLFWLQERASKLRQDARRASGVQIKQDQRVKQFDLQGILERSKGSSGLKKDASLNKTRLERVEELETSVIVDNGDRDMTASTIEADYREDVVDDPSNVTLENDHCNEDQVQPEGEQFLSSQFLDTTSDRRSAELSHRTLSPSLLSSPPPSSPPLPRKIPVNFNDSSSFLSGPQSSAANEAAGTVLLPSPAKPSSASTSGPCTPILKKTGSAIELRGRSVEKVKANKERRVSFSPLVDTRCFEVVSPEGEGSFENGEEEDYGEIDEADDLEDDEEQDEEEVEVEKDEDADDTIEVRSHGTRRRNGHGSSGNWAPAGRSATTQTPTSASSTSAPAPSIPSSASSSWIGRLTSFFGSAPSATAAQSEPDPSSKPLPPSNSAKAPTSSTATPASHSKQPPYSDFTNAHHRLLLALYLESIQHPCAGAVSSSLPPSSDPTSTEKPLQIRPAIQALVGRARYSYSNRNGDAGKGAGKGRERREWIFDQRGAEVLERWLRWVGEAEAESEPESEGGEEAERGKGKGKIRGRGEGRWSGRERELGKRLWSVVVGWEEREGERERERGY